MWYLAYLAFKETGRRASYRRRDHDHEGVERLDPRRGRRRL